MDDLFVINETGQLLFSWHQKKIESTSDDDLISGFLTALNSFVVCLYGLGIIVR